MKKNLLNNVIPKLSLKNIKEVIFWIWIIFVSLITAIFINACGTISSTILSIVVISLVIYSRKYLYNNIFKYILAILLIPIFIMVLIVFISPLPVTSVTTTVSTSLDGKNVDIPSAVFASEVESGTFKPIKITSTFKATEKINYVLHCKYIPAGIVINYSWIYAGNIVIKESYTVAEDINDQYFNITFGENDQDLPIDIGKYTAVVYGIKDGVETFRFTGECNVVE